jgi:hypothetical protein
MKLPKNQLELHIRLQHDLELHMQLWLMNNIGLDENEDEKCTYIILFNGIQK